MSTRKDKKFSKSTEGTFARKLRWSKTMQQPAPNPEGRPRWRTCLEKVNTTCKKAELLQKKRKAMDPIGRKPWKALQEDQTPEPNNTLCYKDGCGCDHRSSTSMCVRFTCSRTYVCVCVLTRANLHTRPTILSMLLVSVNAEPASRLKSHKLFPKSERKVFQIVCADSGVLACAHAELCMLRLHGCLRSPPPTMWPCLFSVLLALLSACLAWLRKAEIFGSLLESPAEG